MTRTKTTNHFFVSAAAPMIVVPPSVPIVVRLLAGPADTRRSVLTD